MPYADYDYYFFEYHGTMEERDFKRLSRQASAYLDAVCFDRIKGVVNDDSLMKKVREACCAVAETYLLNESGGGVASETNDGISVTYVNGRANALTNEQRLYRTALIYLGNTGLMYRGVDGC